MRYAYPCEVIRDEEEARATGREAYNASFPDVHGAHTGGWSVQEVNDRLQDCLEVALSGYVTSGKDVPEPSEPKPGQVLVAVSPPLAAKFALYTAMRQQGVSLESLAGRLGVRVKRARQLIDPYHSAKTADVEGALRALGRTLCAEDWPTVPGTRAVSA